MDATDPSRAATKSPRHRQPYSLGMLYTAVARAPEIPLGKLFWDPAAVVAAYQRARGVLPPAFRQVPEVAAALAKPTIAHFSYGHISTLGAEIAFPDDGEPHPRHLTHAPDDVYCIVEDPIVADKFLAIVEVARELGGAR